MKKLFPVQQDITYPSRSFRERYRKRPTGRVRAKPISLSEPGRLASLLFCGTGSILEESGLIQILPPFVGGKSAEISKRPKVFFRDTGILNAVGGQFIFFDEHPNRGPLFENWVAAELAKYQSHLDPSDSIRFWRTRSKAEVDFVVETDDLIAGIEVKATEMKRPKLSRSSHSFIEAYNPEAFYVVNLSLDAEQCIGQTTVRWIGPEFCAQLPLVGVKR